MGSKFVTEEEESIFFLPIMQLDSILLDMGNALLYQQIAEHFRQEILNGNLKPGDRLPSLRDMTRQWNCAVSTAQRAYHELAKQGLVTSRAGQGTKVAETLPGITETPLRRAALIHKAESFLLEVIAAGYSPPEVENAVRQALDRWRTLEQNEIPADPQIVRFAGSHDLVIAWLAGYFPEISPGFTLELEFSGSLGGLIALAENKSEIAGCHLWDEESKTYNLAYVHRLLPNQRVAVQTLAHRRLGLIIPKGNPQEIKELKDLTRPETRFANRQPGSGSRVWLDAHLRKLSLPVDQIKGYDEPNMTHLEVALAVAEGRSDVGLGLEAAAHSYDLDFIPLTMEQYDLIIPVDRTELPPVKKLMDWFIGSGAKEEIGKFAGYDTENTGKILWLE
jgi:molybdate-binding protein/DNA-binding transcriptional regulator YhcF (GntR family)